MTDVYHKIHLGFIRKPLLEISSDGFIYRGKTYSLDDVREVRFAGGVGSPAVLGIDLNDGKKVLINSSALELNGRRYRNGFISGTNEAFEKLKTYFASARCRYCKE